MSTAENKPFTTIVEGFMLNIDMRQIGPTPSIKTAKEVIDGMFGAILEAFEGRTVGAMYDENDGILHIAFLDRVSAEACQRSYDVAKEMYDDWREN